MKLNQNMFKPAKIPTPTSQGMAGYDDIYMITNVSDDTHFDVTAAYVATGTGTGIRGTNATITAAGVYRFHGWINAKGISGGSTWELATFINAINSNRGTPSIKLNNTTDIGTVAATWLMDLSVGDRIIFAIRNITNTNNLSILSSNVSIVRI